MNALLIDLDAGLTPRRDLAEIDAQFPDAKLYALGHRPRMTSRQDGNTAWLYYWDDNNNYVEARRLRLRDDMSIRDDWPHTWIEYSHGDCAGKRDAFEWLVELDRQPDPPPGAVQGREWLEVAYVGMTRDSVRNRLQGVTTRLRGPGRSS